MGEDLKENALEDSKELEKKKKETKKNIINFFKNKPLVFLILILLFSFLVRVYYFSLTKDQAVWWDEAEYLLKAKNIALNTPETGFWEGRPILFSILLSFFYFIGMGELSIRFFLILISVFTVFLVYLVGEKLFNKNIALLSSFFYSIVYVNLFYSMRIMVDVLHITLGLSAYYLFLLKKQKATWLVFPLIAIGTLIRFPTFLFFVILILYILSTERLNALKNKDYWISGIISLIIVSPYLIWNQLKLGHPLYPIIHAGSGALEGITFSSGLSIFMQYINSFPYYLNNLLLIILFIGILFFLDVFLGLDLVFKNKNKFLNSKFLILIWIMIPLLYFGFGVSHYEDRYIFMIFPAMFYIISYSIIKISEYLKKIHKKLPMIFIIFILITGSYQLLVSSDNIIKRSISSYGPVKDAALWIKQNSKPGDIILTQSRTQNTYYSERHSYAFSDTKEDLIKNISELNPKYIIISIFEKHPEWAYSQQGLSEFNYTPLKAFNLDSNPVLIIYEKS